MLAASALSVPAVRAAGDEAHHQEINAQRWSFGGLRGSFDNAQLQRGFKVYVEVCSRCHGLKRLAFRNLTEKGGPEFPEAAVKSLAATYQVDAAPDDDGKVKKRPAILSDYMPSPYKNDNEARASQNGALPPDLSLITKARGIESNAPFYMFPVRLAADIVTGYQEAGSDYLYSFITGYKTPPAGYKLGDFMNYNTAFPGNQTAMPNPFAGGDGLVKYDDDTPATVENYAKDVTAFLSWIADPRLEERKRLGLLVVLYLCVTAGLLGAAKRRIWKDVPH
ncbi:MAG: cytochrome c1 [Hyphomicrobiaceae bacterium]|nr:cytochrome c1 [Hyphomicrobiaceae bacterium]